MPRQADLIDRLTLDEERLETFGDQRVDLTEPRALLTITRSPFLIPSRLASAVPISTKAFGTRPTSQGMLRLMAPVCQCSETR